MVRENCGVVGVFSLDNKNVIPILIDSLRALQHRGQESWGIAVPDKQPFKQLGLVSSYATNFKTIIKKFKSNAAIGHVRYSTFGKSTIENAQPLKVKDLCIAHNGTIANIEEMANMVGGCTFTPQNMSDTLIAAKRLVEHLSNNMNMKDSIQILKQEMIGSFCFTFLTDQGSVYAARDTKGFRPLVLGFHQESNTYIVASESCAFSAVDAYLLRDIEPGEIIKLSNKGLETEIFSAETPHAHCAFEYTYFAHPVSIMEGVNIYSARKRIGEFLGKIFPIDSADIVIPVPDSARPAALGYAQQTGLPFEEGLVKDRHINKGTLRSFIEPYQSDRVEINKGILPIKDIINNKNVIVIDDSIIRGTSSESIIRTIRNAGAKKIYMIVTYPPVRYPCYAGIDFPSMDELLANQYTIKEGKELDVNSKVSKLIGADEVFYNNTTNLAKAIGISEEELCFTCSTGNYSPLGITPKFRTRREIKGEDN
ncbi:MAG TPA: amidophosphoribosyltransferase [Nitrososphaeraceae archaeon]|nr:amidophosphoribosyltransferase [Nitrososphaeraceae archaeon]